MCAGSNPVTRTKTRHTLLNGVCLSVLFKYIFRYIAVFVIEIRMFLKSCIEVDFDIQLFIFFAYLNTVYKQAEVGITYSTLLNYPFDYVNGFFDF